MGSNLHNSEIAFFGVSLERLGIAMTKAFLIDDS